VAAKADDDAAVAASAAPASAKVMTALRVLMVYAPLLAARSLLAERPTLGALPGVSAGQDAHRRLSSGLGVPELLFTFWVMFGADGRTDWCPDI
jgi:hypothetical protein